jgi:hypothetical protein
VLRIISSCVNAPLLDEHQGRMSDPFISVGAHGEG